MKQALRIPSVLQTGLNRSRACLCSNKGEKSSMERLKYLIQRQRWSRWSGAGTACRPESDVVCRWSRGRCNVQHATCRDFDLSLRSGPPIGRKECEF